MAIDIDARFLDGIAADNLRSSTWWMNHCLPESFDLTHSRGVLTHLSARDVVLDKMIRALRPGGLAAARRG